MTVLLNDSVGTAAGGRYQDERTMLGIILGTGTNACYVERASRLPPARLPEGYDVARHSGQMLINTEWGNFTSATLPVTQAGSLSRQLGCPAIMRLECALRCKGHSARAHGRQPECGHVSKGDGFYRVSLVCLDSACLEAQGGKRVLRWTAAWMRPHIGERWG